MKKYYITKGGLGDGSKKTFCGSDLREAAEALSDGGEIIVVGEYNISQSKHFRADLSQYQMPITGKKLTIRGIDENAVIKADRTFNLGCGGETEIKNIRIEGTGDLFLNGRYNPITIGEGVNIKGFNTAFVIGGCNATAWPQEYTVEGNTDITIKSGNFTHVVGFDRAIPKTRYIGKARVTVEGGSVSFGIIGLAGHNNDAYCGNRINSLEVVLKGGKVGRVNDMDTAKCGQCDSFSLYLKGGEVLYAFPKNAKESVIYSDSEDDKGYIRNKDNFTRRVIGGKDDRARKLRVLCVGDSITEGCGASDQDKYSYPSQLQYLLGCGRYDVRNASRGGACVINDFGNAFMKTDHYIKSLSYGPDIVLLMLGTNDNMHLIKGEEYIRKFERDFSAFIKSYKELKTKPKVYVLSATVRSDLGARVETLENVLLPMQKRIALENGCDFVDMHELTRRMPWLMPEGLHPGDITYGYMASYLCRLIKGETEEFITRA